MLLWFPTEALLFGRCRYSGQTGTPSCPSALRQGQSTRNCSL